MEAPEHPFVKISYHVAFQLHSLKSYYGMVVRNSNGNVLSGKKLQANKIDESIINAYIMDFKTLSLNFTKCKFWHTPRQGNEVAHILANEGYGEKQTFTC
ncbi:hypothetical protein Goarm_018898 [Gossypium armourianum]|uniref:RNase H type-1 domain-containing protein n=1 Tax=Gossypium armourianum TaxID=34283 RepID=A0A7J9IIZ1_9ROSI|nr:hypothetical protein [Gossypium armourianum]